MDRSKLISVVLVDEYPLFRKAMADLLNATGEFQVLGQTGEGDTALGLSSLGPDIVVMSLEAEEYSALDLLKEIKYRQPATRVVMVMSSADSSGQLMRAIRLEANGYLLRTITPSDFVEQLRKTAQGGMAVSEKVTSALAEKLRGDLEPRDLQVPGHFRGNGEGSRQAHAQEAQVPLPRGARRLGVGTRLQGEDRRQVLSESAVIPKLN